MPKAFISYCHEDDRKREILEELLVGNNIEPVVVANRKRPSVLLSNKVIEGIEESDFLIPIMTKNSIDNQWVNQEIGYASKLAKDRGIKIFAIVQDSIINELRGFIHKQIDLPFMFKGGTDKATENYYFKKECKELIKYLKSLPDDKGELKFFISKQF